MNALRRRLAILAALAALAASVPATAQVSAPADPPAVLNPGDAVRITVWQRPELSGEFDIAADGTISHPLLRDVRAGGLEFSALEAKVRESLLRYLASPQFVVQPEFRVSVGGEVRLPGLQTLGPQVTIVQALARAGGTTDRARLDRVQLVRAGVVRTLDLTQAGNGAETMSVRSGDQIVVPRKTSLFRDYVAPAGSVTAAAAAILNIILSH